MSRVAEDIPFVDVVQTNFAGDGTGRVQRFRRGSGLVVQFKIGMERGEVQRNVRAKMLEDPFRELARFSRIVIQRGIIRLVIRTRHSSRFSATAAFPARAEDG